jgi:hypothetical protein
MSYSAASIQARTLPIDSPSFPNALRLNVTEEGESVVIEFFGNCQTLTMDGFIDSIERDGKHGNVGASLVGSYARVGDAVHSVLACIKFEEEFGDGYTQLIFPPSTLVDILQELGRKKFIDEPMLAEAAIASHLRPYPCVRRLHATANPNVLILQHSVDSDRRQQRTDKPARPAFDDGTDIARGGSDLIEHGSLACAEIKDRIAFLVCPIELTVPG